MFGAGPHLGDLHQINASFVIFVHCAVDDGGALFELDGSAEFTKKLDEADDVAKSLGEGDILALSGRKGDFCL